MVVYIYFPILCSCQTACTAYCHPYYVWLSSGVSVVSEVRPIIAVYSRFYDICVYVCLSARALHKTMHTLCKSCHIGPLCIVLWSTIWGVALSLGMAGGASSAEDSPDSDSDLGRTRTATGCRKHGSSQTTAQREERLAAEQLNLAYSFLYYLYIIAICTYLSMYII